MSHEPCVPHESPDSPGFAASSCTRRKPRNSEHSASCFLNFRTAFCNLCRSSGASPAAVHADAAFACLSAASRRMADCRSIKSRRAASIRVVIQKESAGGPGCGGGGLCPVVPFSRYKKCVRANLFCQNACPFIFGRSSQRASCMMVWLLCLKKYWDYACTRCGT